jgi:hypothetical protein
LGKDVAGHSRHRSAACKQLTPTQREDMVARSE